MSDAVFPDFPGRMWDIKKRPTFNTKVMTAVDLSELRASFSATPLYHFGFGIDVLRDRITQGAVTYDELRTLFGFYCQRLGRWDSFLYNDVDDNSVVDQQFGIGDGFTTVFNLRRTMGGFSERVANVNTLTSVAVDATPTVDFTLGAQGVITFDTAPAAAAVLTWTGTYYFRCRFTNDVQEFNQFMRALWNLQQLEFDGSLGTKI